jgi:SAM-dependent methyltransferase
MGKTAVVTTTSANWSEELEHLHEESSRDHFIDVHTRRSMLERLGPLPAEPTIVDVGCSTGYLLEDLAAMLPAARLVGFDVIFSGLVKAVQHAKGAAVGQADACLLPLSDASADAVVSANVLEHVPDDRAALGDIRRVLRPGARAVIVVPAAPGTYDYYDRFLQHQRRYARGELARKAWEAGLVPLEELFLGSLLFPAFWAVKKYHRARFDHLRDRELAEKVMADIASTKSSRLGEVACDLERALFRRKVPLPFGIRVLTVVERPAGTAG